MKKKLTIGLICIVVLAVAGVGYLLFFNKQDTEKSLAPEEVLTSQLDRACQIFTEEKAKTILGTTATKSYDGEIANSSSDDIAVSHCVYEDGNDKASATETKIRASLVVRTHRTQIGQSANQSVFEKSSRPAGSVDVMGYGEQAFWNPEFGQLNVLKNGDWYVIEYGPLIPSSRAQGDTLKFADILKTSL